MSEENISKVTDNSTLCKSQHVSSNYSNDKPMTEIEYLEYMSKKAKTVHTITYPDGSKGELNRCIVVLL